jgi:flagellar basal body-associated protein FliL
MARRKNRPRQTRPEAVPTSDLRKVVLILLGAGLLAAGIATPVFLLSNHFNRERAEVEREKHEATMKYYQALEEIEMERRKAQAAEAKERQKTILERNGPPVPAVPLSEVVNPKED